MLQEYTAKKTTHRQHAHARRRGQPLRYAFVLHRLSGLLLVIFLPMHFWVLSLAVSDADRLALYLEMTHNPVVKLAETVLVGLLAVHFFGGMRLMAFEWFGWPAYQKTAAAAVLSVAVFIAMLFLFRTL